MFDFIYSFSDPYLVITIVLIITGTGVPIPEEVPIVAAGVLSRNGQMETGLALICCLVGALLGDCVMYAIGYHFGRNVVQDHRWFARFLTPQREARIEKMIEEHGIKMFLMARFVVGLRSPVYLTSGILRVPFRRFIFIDAICASIVISVFFALSYTFAPHIQMVWHWIRGAEYTLTGLVILAIAAGVYWYIRRRRQRFRLAMARRRRRREHAAAKATAVLKTSAKSDAAVANESAVDVEAADKKKPASDNGQVDLGGNVATADLHSASDTPGSASHAGVD